MIDSICQYNVIEGFWRTATTPEESPSREKILSCGEATRDVASWAARALP